MHNPQKPFLEEPYGIGDLVNVKFASGSKLARITSCAPGVYMAEKFTKKTGQWGKAQRVYPSEILGLVERASPPPGAA